MSWILWQQRVSFYECVLSPFLKCGKIYHTRKKHSFRCAASSTYTKSVKKCRFQSYSYTTFFLPCTPQALPSYFYRITVWPRYSTWYHLLEWNPLLYKYVYPCFWHPLTQSELNWLNFELSLHYTEHVIVVHMGLRGFLCSRSQCKYHRWIQLSKTPGSIPGSGSSSGS